MPADAFLDSNVVLYLLSADTHKADRAESLLAKGAVVSVQVLNEVTSVARRKLGLAWEEVDDLLAAVRAHCSVQPLTVDTHAEALRLARDTSFSFYDALIVASALEAGCRTLYSEDMHDGRVVARRLTVRNPFR